MGLRSARRSGVAANPLESLESRRMFVIEAATAAVPVDGDANLVVQSAATASAADGTSVVAYSDRDSVSGKGNEVYLHRYTSSGGSAAASERVNTTTANAQMNPDVATSGTNNYAVVWQSENQDGSGWGVYARAHTSSGWSSEILVNTTTTGAQVSPKIAMATDGTFVVTWVGRDDNSGNGVIYGRRFNANGTAATGETAITANGNFAYTSPDVAINGTVAFTWVTSDIANAGQTDIQYRSYDATFTTPAAIQTVNTVTAGDQAEPAIAGVGASGSFVVVWSDNQSNGPEAIISARRTTGTFSLPQVQISQDTDGTRSRPRIAARGSTVVIGWTQQVIGATATSTVLRTYDNALTATGNESVTTDGQNARTLYDVTVTGTAAYREVTTLGEFSGYGVATTAALANVIRIDGTSGNDQTVAYELNSTTIRTSVNGVTKDYARALYAYIRVELGDGRDIFNGDQLTSMWCTVSGGAGNDTIRTGSGADSISAGDGDDSVDAGAGNDYVIGNSGNDLLYGKAGDDTLTGSAGKDALYGGFGSDRLAGSGSPDRLFGEDDDDRLYGEDGDDGLDGGGGRDRLYGGAGNDSLMGGSSNDRLFGDIGNDTLVGGKGNDYLDGGANTDLVVGKEPGDTLISIEKP